VSSDCPWEEKEGREKDKCDANCNDGTCEGGDRHRREGKEGKPSNLLTFLARALFDLGLACYVQTNFAPK
jgi:hypothetical protein